jgi:hypothetical protein
MLAFGFAESDPDAGVEQQHLVRFPVFANQLSDVGPELEGTDLIQEPFHLIAIVAIGDLQLPLGKPLQKAAAGLADLLGACVDTLEELVRDRDHHLGHRASIDGIADD